MKWVIGEEGDAANLARASALLVGYIDRLGKNYYVEAMLPGFSRGELSGDSDYFQGSQYGVSVVLKEFDSKKDAKKYVADLVEKLNGEKI